MGLPSGNVSLSWTDVPDWDLSHYRVYRRVAGGDWTLLADQVSGPAHVDTTGQSGTSYEYAVSAVDSAGNEGSISDLAAMTFP